MNTTINWPEIIAGNEKMWLSAYGRLEEDTREYPWLQRWGAQMLWFLGLPSQVVEEAYKVAEYLKVDPDLVMAAQVVYDEGWIAEDAVPGHGCTSVSTDKGFGRNMDYAYPENASDYIYHQDIQVGDTSLHIEGFAGVLGWLAYRGDTSAASFNQAPALRKIRRTKTPGLMWFREHSLLLESLEDSDIADEGDVWVNPTASDFLLHFVKGDRRFLGEVFDGQLVWERQHKKAVQANTYQILDLEAHADWTEDSDYRISVARKARGIKSSLAAAANEYTADSIILM